MRPVTQASRDAVRRGHKRETTVRLWSLDAGMVGVLPISDGTVEWSLSAADGVRSGRVTVPGYDWWPMVEPGRWTYVTVDVSIEEKTWEFGEFPVTRAVMSRPKGVIELTLGDWAYRRAQPDGESAVTIGATNQTVKAAVETYMVGVMPGGTWTITRDDSGGALCQSPVELPLGGNVWTALTTLANQVGCVIVCTSRTSGQIRRWPLDDNVVPQDTLAGTIVSETVGVLADEAVNKVIVVGEMSNPGGDPTVFRAVRTLTDGPYRYARDGIGMMTLVESMRQPTVTQALVDAEADRIFRRRAGIVRSYQAEVVPQPWLEVGDLVISPSTRYPDVPGLIDSLSFPLTAKGVQRVTMRDQSLV